VSDPSSLSNQELDDLRKHVDPQAAVGRREKRTSERFAYPVVAAVAPYGAWGVPKNEMFREVRCYDISRGGVSFLLSAPPNFKSAVVRLGTSPDLIHMLVRVMHCTLHDEARKEYLVGCQFVQRLKALS